MNHDLITYAVADTIKPEALAPLFFSCVFVALGVILFALCGGFLGKRSGIITGLMFAAFCFAVAWKTASDTIQAWHEKTLVGTAIVERALSHPEDIIAEHEQGSVTVGIRGQTQLFGRTVMAESTRFTLTDLQLQQLQECLKRNDVAMGLPAPPSPAIASR